MLRTLATPGWNREPVALCIETYSTSDSLFTEKGKKERRQNVPKEALRKESYIMYTKYI